RDLIVTGVQTCALPISVALIRPIAKSHLRVPSALRTGTAALTGAKAIVLQRVDQDGGRVKIGGEEWSARAYMDGQVFEPGARVRSEERRGGKGRGGRRG